MVLQLPEITRLVVHMKAVVPVELLRPVQLLVELEELLLDDAEPEVEALVRQKEDVGDEVEALGAGWKCNTSAPKLIEIPL